MCHHFVVATQLKIYMHRQSKKKKNTGKNKAEQTNEPNFTPSAQLNLVEIVIEWMAVQLILNEPFQTECEIVQRACTEIMDASEKIAETARE